MIRRRLADESGFSLIVVMLLMLGASAIFVATYSAANGDITPTATDRDRKQAYAAAEAGIDYYRYHLTQDNGYWANCANVPAPGAGQLNPVNDVWDGQGTDPRRWRALPGSTSKYTIELLPAPGSGYASCSSANAQASMIDQASGTFQIRSTGWMNGQKRSVVATFRRKTFLDYVYFTDYETMDPVIYQTQDQSWQAWYAQNCSKYKRDGRPYPPCSDIVFASTDQIKGPFHTNDEMRTCGAATFGRTTADAIEVSGAAPGWTSGCSGSPNFLGTYTTAAPVLAMPQSNAALKSVAASQYLFTGTTTIVLSGTTMTVTNAAAGLTNASRALPANGVIYVQNGVCGTSYTLTQNYNDPQGCANVYLRGDYSQSLTIASENDVIVNGNINRGGDAMLGLIPNNFVRVYHPVTNRDGTNCTNASSSPTNVSIDAAILTLAHSFIVDNYYCGAVLGTLSVDGAIAQKFRGPVGTGGSSITHGYIKDYNFDDRLKYANPPYFLSPLQAPWDLMRFNEQTPPQ